MDKLKLVAREARKKDNARFGGMKEIVFKRDGFRCVDCSMTEADHLERWGKRLTVNHINCIGRNSGKPDNRLENLETLCLRCHGKKDSQNINWHKKVTYGGHRSLT